MSKRDITREELGELIEEAIAKAINSKRTFFENANVTLESDGHVSMKLGYRNDVYDIRVSRRTRK